MIFTEPTHNVGSDHTGRFDNPDQMTEKRENLIAEARQIRENLNDLPERDVNVVIREVLSCYAPFFASEDLEGILKESRQH